MLRIASTLSHKGRGGSEPTDLPDRLSRDTPVQPLWQKYFCFSEIQIRLYVSPSRPTEGRVAIVTAAGWDAVDADAPITNGAKADGEVVWS
jgi:hypothetical protein